MLQQTTVAAVIPYYERWMTKWPTLQEFATASEDEVLAMWQGLGYYRRARQLLAGAKTIATSGLTPTTCLDWREVPGIGPYTAAAIASIACGEAVALVDGNVMRVYARIVADGSARPQLERNAWRWAEENLVDDRPGDWNQALMELGATVCRPRAPLCDDCPVAEFCAAYQQGVVGDFPRPPEPKDWRVINHYAAMYIKDGHIALQQAAPGEWWSGLWTLPRLSEPGDGEELAVIRHVVTNHKITLSLRRWQSQPPGSKLFSMSELSAIAIPSPDKKLLAKVGKLFGND